MNILQIGSVLAIMSLAACGNQPGGFTGELKPVIVAGHAVHTVVAQAWMKTCFGQPDQITTMLSQFEHNPGDRYLTHIASGTTITEGDCNALLKAAGMAAAGALVRPSTTNNVSTSTTSTNVGVVVN